MSAITRLTTLVTTIMVVAGISLGALAHAPAGARPTPVLAAATGGLAHG